jgi:hypothetical protein
MTREIALTAPAAPGFPPRRSTTRSARARHRPVTVPGRSGRDSRSPAPVSHDRVLLPCRIQVRERRTARITGIAPGAVVMAMIYTWGPLSGCTSMPRSPPVSRPAGSFRRAGLCRTGWLSSPGRSALSCSCRRCSVTSPWVGVPDLRARRGLAGIRHRDRHDGPGRFCCIASTPAAR